MSTLALVLALALEWGGITGVYLLRLTDGKLSEKGVL